MIDSQILLLKLVLAKEKKNVIRKQKHKELVVQAEFIYRQNQMICKEMFLCCERKSWGYMIDI